MLKSATQDSSEIINNFIQGHFYPAEDQQDISGQTSTSDKDSLVEHILDFLDSYYPAPYGTSPSMHGHIAYSNLGL